jgi:hypothetical protein
VRVRGQWRSRTALARVAASALALLVFTATGAIAGGEPADAVSSIGIYPTRLDFDSVLRGGEYFKTIGVINNSGSPATFSVTAAGDIAKWADFVDPTNVSRSLTQFTVQARGQVGLRVRVPAKLANGTYLGVVHILSNPLAIGSTSNGASSQGVKIGADLAVTVIVVGAEVIRGSLLDSRAPQKIEAGYRSRLTNIVANSGNVQIRPNFNVVITHGDTTVATLKFQDRTVDSGATAPIETDWKTTPATAIGGYIAHVTASAQGVPLGAREVRFEVVPFGTLSRNGAFESLKVTNKPVPGQAARVEAVFRNTGAIETNATFVGELDLNGHVVRGVTSVPELVQVGDVRTIEMFVRVDVKGHYTFKGRINFDGRQTNGRLVAFGIGTHPNRLPDLLAAVAVLALIVSSAWWFLRRRTRPTLDERLRQARGAAAPETRGSRSVASTQSGRRGARVHARTHVRKSRTRRSVPDAPRRAGRN